MALQPIPSTLPFWRQLGQLATTLPKVPGRQPRPAKEGQKGGWSSGGRSTMKPMKTAPRTWEAGGTRMCSRGAGVPPARHLGSGKTSERPMFSVISHPMPCMEAAPPKSPRCSFRSFRATSGGAASCRARGEWAAKRPHCILSLVPIHLSGRSGILPRPSGWSAGGRQKNCLQDWGAGTSLTSPHGEAAPPSERGGASAPGGVLRPAVLPNRHFLEEYPFSHLFPRRQLPSPRRQLSRRRLP